MSLARSEEFWSRVDRHGPDECWPWKSTITEKGYGRFWFKGIRTAAHRFAYMAVSGPIPAGKVIDHLCRNRACVNPAHLEVVTNRENVLRGVGRSAVAARRTQCRKGHPFDRVTPQGDRYCLACGAERKRSWRRRRVLAGDKAENWDDFEPLELLAGDKAEAPPDVACPRCHHWHLDYLDDEPCVSCGCEGGDKAEAPE